MRFLPIIFLGLVNILWGVPHSVLADIVATSSGVQTGEVVRVDRDNVFIRLPVGEVPVPKADIVGIEITQPPTYGAAVKALNQRKFKEAIEGLKPIVDRVGGIEIGWIEDAVLQLGDAYVGAGEFASAKRIFDGFRALYADNPKVAGIEVKYSRILVGQKKYETARDALLQFVEPLLVKKSITEAEENALSEALLLLGDAERALGQSEDALDRYLAVVALFDVDSAMTAEAKFKAAQVFEELKKWDRAKTSYEELAGSVYADEARQRLVALQKAQP